MEARFRNCEEVQQELMDWLAGELPETDKQTIAAHLAQCPGCQYELDTLQQLWTSMGSLPVPAPSEELRPNFYAMLADFKAEEQRRQRWSVQGLLQRLREWWQPAFAQRLAYGAVLLLVGLGIGYGLKGREMGTGTDESLARLDTPAPTEATARQVGVLAYQHPHYEARSAGTEPGARVRVTAGHLGWADVVVVMERKHADYLQQKFPEALLGKQLIILRIPDKFQFMDHILQDLLQERLQEHLSEDIL